MGYDSKSGKAAKEKASSRKGVPNKVTRSMKETVTDTLEWLQKQPRVNMRDWAKENTTEFYKIATKLIPTEIVGKDGEALIPIGMIEVVKNVSETPK